MSQETPHRVVNPPSLLAPRGFSHAVVAAPGRTVYLGGQTAHRQDGSLADGGLVEQFDGAAANLVTALDAAGASPEQLVSLHIYVTDAQAYRDAVGDLTPVYRRHLARHYPAMALFEISGLADPDALVELVGIAVVPEDPGATTG